LDCEGFEGRLSWDSRYLFSTMENLDLEWSKFKLTAEEEEVVVFEEEIRVEKKEEIDLSLVEKFFTQNNINTKVIKTAECPETCKRTGG